MAFRHNILNQYEGILILDTLLALADPLLFGALILTLVLGVTCLAMAIMSNKSGAEVYKERIEYGFFSVSCFCFMGLVVYLMA